MAFLTYRASSTPTLPTTTSVSTAGLTNLQVDGNFASLDSAKYEKTGGTISGDVVITGNLNTTSNSVTINSTNVLVSDKNISIGSVVAVNALSGTINSTALNATVTMTAPSTTAGLIPGTSLIKTTGVGVFGTGAVIASVDSLTQITILTTSVNTIGAIAFNTGSATDLTANGGGITLKGASDKTIIWDSTNSNWTSSENWNIVTGKVFKINNTSVLSSTTLGSGVTSSSLTSVGTLATGTWNATTIASNYGGTGYTTYATGDILYASATNVLSKLAKATDGNVLMLVSGVPAWAAEADTLATVTGRGATTATALTITNATSSALTVTGGVTIGGNLVVNGITTSINSTTLTVDDKNIELGAVGSANFNITGNITAGSAIVTGVSSTANLVPGSLIASASGVGTVGLPASLLVSSIDSATQITVNQVLTGTGTAPGAILTFSGATDATANGGGITLKGATDKTIIWDSTNSNWTSSENLNIPTGKVFKVNNASVLTATTLGTSVINSYLTKLGTTSGFVKSDGNGNLSADTNTYLTATTSTAVSITNTASALSTTTGALQVTGGVGIQGALYVGGTIDGTTFNSTSDARLKSEIEVIENALDKTLSLNGYTFLLNSDKSKRQTGVIAQEVLKVLPEAVSGTEDTHYSVSYGNIVGLLIEAIKELNTKVTDLQNQLANK